MENTAKEIATEKGDRTTTLCTHCGTPCTDVQLIFDEHAFCCKGCQAVYEMLHQSGLGHYYHIEDRPGVSLASLQREQYAYLDTPDVQAKLLDFSDGEKARITLYLPEIHCASCIWLLEHLYRLDQGVLQSTVNFPKKEAYITFSLRDTSLSKLAALLQQIGYPPNINLADLDDKPKPAVSKALYYKLGVTGFIFGNIMFMSFPEYLGLDKSVDSWAYQLFGYLNLIMGLPLVFYSGWDYLRSAFLGLRQKVLNIDVPISIGILSLFGRSVYEILTHTGAGYMDSLAGLVFFLLVGKWFQQKTYHGISFERDYQSYFPIAAHRIIGKEETAVSLKDLKIGDRIRIRNQELIPADGVLMQGEAYIDYSFVTGESAPVRVEQGAVVYAGGRQMGTSIELELVKEVIQSYLVQLWNEHTFQNKENHQHSSALANKIGTFFTYFILLTALATLLYWLPKDVSVAINAFSAVLIIACPCAVALSIPFTFGNVLRILGRHHIYLKNTGVIERLEHITHIVFDKTGTLTERHEQMVFKGNLTDDEKTMVKSLASQSSHPRSQQIVAFFNNYPRQNVENFEETLGLGTKATVGGLEVRIEKGAQGTAVFINGAKKGYFEHQPVLREGLSDVLIQLKKRYDLSLVSGDRNRHQNHFEALFGGASALYFNYTPKEKLQFIQDLQQKGAVVLMVGDGLNDAGALKQADVGLVISEANNNFSPACDGVFSEKVFDKFSAFFTFIHQSHALIYVTYIFALVYNVIGLSFAVQGKLSPVIAAILMPLSSVSIVLLGVTGSWYLGKKHITFSPNK